MYLNKKHHSYDKKDQKYFFNDELYDHAVNNNMFLPDKHFIMPVIPKYMENDNIKFTKSHVWCPDKEAWQLAVRVFNQVHLPHFSNPKVLSFHEAIAIAEKMTSSGWLYKKLGYPKKKDVFDNMLEELERRFNNVFAGIDEPTVFEIAPKVEIRPIEKITSEEEDDRKQRTFMVSDVLHYIVGIALYHDMNEKYISNCNDKTNWNAVGISIFNGGWNNLVQNLKSEHDLFTAYDEKAMEACVTGEFLHVIYDGKNYFLQAYKHATSWFYRNVSYSTIIAYDGSVLLKNGMNPSGHIDTLYVNGLALELKYLYHLAKKLKFFDAVLDKYTTSHLKLLGDDSIVPYDPIWDGVLVSSAELGFETTLESKEGEVIENIRFLNFSFVYDHFYNMYTFEPNYDKLFAGLYYYRKKNSWRLTLARLFAMKILCFNNKYYYDQVMDLINYTLDQHDKDLQLELHLDEMLTYKSLMCQNKHPNEIIGLIFHME